MKIERLSPCKVNLLLNILGRRPDGFHELETLMLPVAVHDRLILETAPQGIELTCSDPSLPVDDTNLVKRAATEFRQAAGLRDGVRLFLEKRIPRGAGLGGGSGNAAATLSAMNELFDTPLPAATLHELAAKLGSDVPFFLQPRAALAEGRGERLAPVGPFPVLAGTWLVLVFPGFGVSTAWAYEKLADFPEAHSGVPGRARVLVNELTAGRRAEAFGRLYNSLEAPVLRKYPILRLFQEFMREQGAQGCLMSGSGSTSFALVGSQAEALDLRERFLDRFGDANWVRVVPAQTGAS